MVDRVIAVGQGVADLAWWTATRGFILVRNGEENHVLGL